MSWVFLVETLQVTQETGKVFLAENMGESSSPPPWKKKKQQSLICWRCFPFQKVSFQAKDLRTPTRPPPSSSVGPTVVPQKSFCFGCLQVHQHWWLRWYLEFRLYLQDLWNFGPYPILGGKTFWRDPGRCGEGFCSGEGHPPRRNTLDTFLVGDVYCRDFLDLELSVFFLVG